MALLSFFCTRGRTSRRTFAKPFSRWSMRRFRDCREHEMALSPTNGRDDGLNGRRCYCVCLKCGAKVFSPSKSFACPRCGRRLRAVERIVPSHLPLTNSVDATEDVKTLISKKLVFGALISEISFLECDPRILQADRSGRGICVIANILKPSTQTVRQQLR
jgi:hypothetical protein